MRLFLGLAPDAGARDHLERFAAKLHSESSVRWASPESWHVTLQFLGNAGQPEYDCLLSSLRNIESPPVAYTIRGSGVFERAGIFYADVERSPSLLRLHRAVLAATSSCGFRGEDAPYHPHITLARRRTRGHGSNQAMRALAMHPVAPLPQLAGEFLLYESHLSSQGARYVARERFPLSGV